MAGAEAEYLTVELRLPVDHLGLIGPGRRCRDLGMRLPPALTIITSRPFVMPKSWCRSAAPAIDGQRRSLTGAREEVETLINLCTAAGLVASLLPGDAGAGTGSMIFPITRSWFRRRFSKQGVRHWLNVVAHYSTARCWSRPAAAD